MTDRHTCEHELSPVSSWVGGATRRWCSRNARVALERPDGTSLLLCKQHGAMYERNGGSIWHSPHPRHFFSICSAHQQRDPDCPLCKVGTWWSA